ncbi:MAG: hypothetical protein ABIN74_08600, partial [Ferruginibacter sp.]
SCGMNSNRHFDEHIKEQFNNYSPGVHPRIWENIIAEKDKKRPPGFWVSMLNGRAKLLVLGLFIALSSGGAWIFFKNITAPNTNTATENNSPVTKSRGSKVQPFPDQQTKSNDPVNDQPTTADNNIAKNNTGLVSNGGLKAQIYSPSLQPGETENSSPGAGKRNKKPYNGLGNILVNTTSPGLDEDEDEDAYEGQGTLLGRLTYHAEKYSEKRKSGKPGPLSFDPIIYLPDCPSIEKNASGNKRYFEFYAGPDYAIRSLHDTGNSAYLQKRKESTKFKSGFSAGIRYTKVFNNSMSVRGGVNYSQINEKFTFSQGNIIQVIYIINTNGDTIGSYTTTGTRYKTTINRYRSIDIPLVAGYELGNGKLHANINAGAIINIYSWQSGDVLDPAGNPVSITTGKSSSPYQFKTNAGIGFIGAASVYYKLNDRLHIMAEPYFRYNFTPMNKETITLKQKYQTAGLRLGIRLDLK